MPQIVHPRTQTFLQHWQDIPRRNGLILPHTDDYLDQSPARLMNSVFIHEIVDDRLLVRFMGTDLVQRWQRDDTGLEFGAHLPLSARMRLSAIAKALALHPCGMVQHGALGTSTGRETMFEGILLPLAVNPGAPARVVVFSVLLDQWERQEHGSKLASAGERSWLDIGAGTPAVPPAAQEARL